MELLRFFFMFCIVIDHIYGHGSGLSYEWLYGLGRNWATAPHLAIFNIGKIGVTGFMFISGYYGIRINRNKITHLLIITTTYAVVLDAIYGFTLHEAINDLHAFDLWWFVKDYLFVCLLAPFIEIGIKKVSRHTFQMAIAGILFVTYFSHLLSFDNSHDLTMLLSIYLIARYLKIYPPLFQYRHAGKFAIFGLLLIGLVPTLASYLGLSFKIQKLWFSNNNILFLFTSWMLMIFATRHTSYNRIINSLATSVLAIYLITDSSQLRHFDKVLLPMVLDWWGYFIALGICLGCLLVDKVRIIITNSLILAITRVFKRRK